MKKRLLCLVMAFTAAFCSSVGASTIKMLDSGTKIISGAAASGSSGDAAAPLNVLTVEDAVKKAVANSSSLKNIDENKDLSQTDLENTSTSIKYYSYTEGSEPDYMDLAVEYKRLVMALSDYDANSEVTKQKIEQSIREYFVSVIKAQNAIDLFEQSMDVQSKQIEIDGVKLKLGLISQTDYNTELNSYNTTKTNIETLRDNLDDAFSNLNVIMGTDQKTKYILEYECDYEPAADEMSLVSIVSKAQSGSYSIRQKKDALEIAKYDYEKYSLSLSDNYSSDTRDQKHAVYNQATRAYGDALDTIESTLTSLYNSLKEMEQNYANNVSTLKSKREQLAVSEKKLELGQITEHELNEEKYNIAELENTITNLEYDHDLLVRQLNNPDLVLQ